MSSTAGALPRMIAARRMEVADRIAGLQRLDEHLATLERCLTRPFRALQVIVPFGACCDAAEAVLGAKDGSYALLRVRAPVAAT